MNGCSLLAALEQLNSLTRAVTQRSVDRLREWAGAVLGRDRADAGLAASPALTPAQADRLARAAHSSAQCLLALAESTDALLSRPHIQCVRFTS